MQLIRTTAALFVLSAALAAADWKFFVLPLVTKGTVPVSDFAVGNPVGGWMVIISEVPDSEKDADAYAITIRFRREGAIWTRTQVIRRDSGANPATIVDAFRVGEGSEYLGVSAQGVRWESKKEVSQ